MKTWGQDVMFSVDQLIYLIDQITAEFFNLMKILFFLSLEIRSDHGSTPGTRSSAHHLALSMHSLWLGCAKCLIILQANTSSLVRLRWFGSPLELFISQGYQKHANLRKHVRKTNIYSKTIHNRCALHHFYFYFFLMFFIAYLAISYFFQWNKKEKKTINNVFSFVVLKYIA